MPNYDYRCNLCGHELEIFQRMSDAPARTCPSCGKEGLERLISRSAFALKGSGWYADGYGAKTESKSTAADTKPDTKPAKTAEEKSATPTPAPSTGGDSTPKKDGGGGAESRAA